jgi:type VI secretion system secreted protein Hcp
MEKSMASGDMFIKIEGARSGVFKGESRDPAHLDEIQLVAWSWGMEGNASATVSAGGRAAGANQVSVRELEIVKRVDSATTALMSALRSNEVLKTVTLSVRKAGGASPVEYLKIILEKGRVRSVDLETGLHGSEELIGERVRISFQRITVEYRPQQAQGGGGGASSFTTELEQA